MSCQKEQPCTGSFTKTLGIPCAHFVRQKMLAVQGCLQKQDFSEQWWISVAESQETSSASEEDPFSVENIESMRKMFNSMPTFDQLIVRRRIESIKTGELLYTLQDPQTNQPKYRPRGAGNRKQDRAKSTTQRNSSQFEYVEVKMKKEEALKKRKAGNDDLHTKKKRIKIKKEPLDSGDDEKDVEANTSEDEDGSAMPEDKYGCLLPKRYYDISSDIDFASYDNIANIKIDGFCGFRAIDKFMEVKFAMRDRLVDVKEAYRTSFLLFNVDELERIVSFGSKTVSLATPYSCGSSFWFLAPDCA
ncbi:hypothetical protein MUCCIDRAFT_79271 [Mucor lusitanicus CBS 277.49]|uniref:Uncharacterized protein n=1 Tax=Mucor lusitanicus CBS 277.49 TaxID=747725 RepID=A0A162QM96_MUCCL|nr:hypothetical protein MUCCIDRAFT_79271 [Mucor lusitanicus CBS 277.49]